MNNQSSSSSSCSFSASDNTSRMNQSSSLPAPPLRSLPAGIRRPLLPSRPPIFAARSLGVIGGLRSSSLNPDRRVRNQREILNAALAVIHADDDFLAQVSSSSSSNSSNKKRKSQRGGPPRQ
ncbi:unnamed protein product [Cylindrotheca closterium]|uniref:Uncharacterized protein n=1 Tax=Cylindrotheca closterium TaxID=2856 RepID=A0AAD2CU44_9STRA|nr:unnamed protein product [Cylindrotheca closterium]